MARKELQTLVAEQKILNRIYVVGGEKVMLDRDRAEMYRVETRSLIKVSKEIKNDSPKILCLL